jgi:hypothetical protein
MRRGSDLVLDADRLFVFKPELESIDDRFGAPAVKHAKLAAQIRLVGAVLCEIDDAWVRVRRSMTQELKQVETKVVGIPRRLKRAS